MAYEIGARSYGADDVLHVDEQDAVVWLHTAMVAAAPASCGAFSQVDPGS
ncbi:TIGR03746 family integrating conjugative element protein [Pseudofrankia sp. DC12]|nr:TIGR03746 family integrating conjugative element protein [Pseudofrankia sp. DC12]